MKCSERPREVRVRNAGQLIDIVAVNPAECATATRLFCSSPRNIELGPTTQKFGAMSAPLPAYVLKECRLAIDSEHNLSDREREVLNGVLEGLSNRQIAARISTTTKNVEYHLARLYVRFNVKTRVQLVRQVLPSPQDGELAAESLQRAEAALDLAKQHIQEARGRFTGGAKATAFSLSIGAIVFFAVGDRWYNHNKSPQLVAARGEPLIKQPMYYRSTGEGGAAIHDQVLGEVAPAEQPKTWWIEIPRKATRVEATIVHAEADGTSKVNLDAQIAGVLQVNGLDALRWLQRNANVNVMRNGLNNSAIICNWGIQDRWIDITPLVRKGVNNSVTYMHQDVKAASVRIRYYDD